MIVQLQEEHKRRADRLAAARKARDKHLDACNNAVIL
jgi:hypothetical protein